jgi:cytochrome c oxidase assembly protein subunit 15
VRLPRLSPAVFRSLALALLVSLVLITVVGAGVRLTGSGLGCSTWPSCEPDSFTPHSASDTHAMIEFANRIMNAAVGALAIAAVVGARLREPRRDDLFRWALGVFAWVVSNGLVGALVVVLELSPASVIGHFVLALGAIWNALILWYRAGEPDEAHEPGPAAASAADTRLLATPRFVTLTKALLIASPGVLITGTLVTGAGPHAGDDRADRLALEVGTIARIHGLTVIAFLALAVAVVWLAQRGNAAPAVAARANELLVVLVGQAAIGYWQYFTGIPALLVAFHVLGATLVWISVLRLWLSLHARVPDGVAVAPARARSQIERATMAPW